MNAIIKHAANGLANGFKHKSVRDYLKMRFAKAIPAAGRITKKAGNTAKAIAGKHVTHVAAGMAAGAAIGHRKGDTAGKTFSNAVGGGLATHFGKSAVNKAKFIAKTTPAGLKKAYKETLNKVGRSRKSPIVKQKLGILKSTYRHAGIDRGIAAVTGTLDAAITGKQVKGLIKRKNKEVKASQTDLLFAKMDLILGRDTLELGLGPVAGAAIGAGVAAGGIKALTNRRDKKSIAKGMVKNTIGKRVAGYGLLAAGIPRPKGLRKFVAPTAPKPPTALSHDALELGVTSYAAANPNDFAHTIAKKAFVSRKARIAKQSALTNRIGSNTVRQASKSVARNTRRFAKPIGSAIGQGIKSLGGGGRAALMATAATGAAVGAHKLAKRVYGGPSVKASFDDFSKTCLVADATSRNKG